MTIIKIVIPTCSESFFKEGLPTSGNDNIGERFQTSWNDNKLKEYGIMTKVQDILILGIGNLLMKDEGVGVHVVERMKTMPLPENVEILDGGTGGLDLMYHMEGRKKLIVIDAVKTGDKPGTIYRLTEENLKAKPKVFFSLHDIDFIDALGMAETTGKKPDEIVVIGIEPKDMSDGLELSPEIEERIPIIIEVVMKELNTTSHCHSRETCPHESGEREPRRL